MLKRLWLTGALAVTALTGCLTDDGVTVDEAVTEGSEPPVVFGVADRGKEWQKDTLTVCWDASTDAFSSDRLAVQDLLTKEWGSVGRIRFEWTICAVRPDADIRIADDPAGGGWSAIGTAAMWIPIGQPTMRFAFAGPPPGGCHGGGSPDTACPGGGGAVGLPADRMNWVKTTALHEMGHALGLRHEHVHPDSTCHDGPERLDEPDHDGEALWAYDPQSVMDYCRIGVLGYSPSGTRIEISDGDIRALNTLYPGGAAIFSGDRLTGNATWMGPGYFTRTSQPALQSMRSLMVPPGFRAEVCTSSACSVFTISQRSLPASYLGNVQHIRLTVSTRLYEQPGYLGASVTVPAGQSNANQLGAVGDNRTSSYYLPMTAELKYCSGDQLTGICTTRVGGARQMYHRESFALDGDDNAISSVKLNGLVAVYTDGRYRGEMYGLPVGTYSIARGQGWLLDVKAVAVQGLSVTACSDETRGPTGTVGTGTCVTSEDSFDLRSFGRDSLRYLAITNPATRL